MGKWGWNREGLGFGEVSTYLRLDSGFPSGGSFTPWSLPTTHLRLNPFP